MPYITDAVAHILNFKGHMATVHAHNGKYHVHMEVAEAAKNDNGEKSTNTLKKYGSENEHIGIDKDCVRHSQYEARKYFTALPMTAISIYLNNDFPPPRG